MMASSSKKTWKEKYELQGMDYPKVCSLDAKQKKQWGVDTMLISSPKEIDALMKRVPKGKLTTMNDIREALAAKYGADTTCPMTTGIFANIVAHFADEQASQGKKRITPYWRTLKKDGEVNPKFPFGVKGQKQLLEHEGHKVIKRGKRLFVADYEKKLAKLKT